MDDAYIAINNGDNFTIEQDPDGYPAVKIENTAFLEEPRWLLARVAGNHDRYSTINALIDALTTLRDESEEHR